MKANHNTKPSSAPGAETGIKFDLKEVGYENLDGQFINLIFDKKELGNMLFANASTVEMDALAKAIHATGEANADSATLDELDAIITHVSQYNRRVKTAITDYINKLKGETNHE